MILVWLHYVQTAMQRFVGVGLVLMRPPIFIEHVLDNSRSDYSNVPLISMGFIPIEQNAISGMDRDLYM